MPRVSKAQTELNYRRILEVTAARIREAGVDKVSVPEVMAAAGLTHGGFYRHFASKDDLVARATAVAFAQREEEYQAAVDGHSQGLGADGETRREETYRAYLEGYVSEFHRDNPGTGCPAAALAFDAAHVERDTSDLKGAYVDGVRRMVDNLEKLATDGKDVAQDRQRALVDLATMVGAITLARATAHDGLSNEILTAVRGSLLDARPTS
ncbi:TetR/AcrR family transcriptional regulator [Streptomyces sp. CoH27]|uniref:TetR/AcrR family transcriptional regulator n=1 Tax=Streptomyces sp. CoH27 TaxID=2875763 RepID=UPI001CD7410C|nr:TetR/AcrR family transcriptional regulator [Streptomyces sp. CoH27]